MNIVMHRRQAALALASLALFVFTGSAPAQMATPPGEDRLVVFAAASLQDAFAAMADAFERGRPGIDVVFNFAGTQELRTQLEHGVLADVFASADQKHMNELVRSSRVARPVVFARNEPVIVVARESAATIRSLADLPSAERIVVGVPEVPIGRYTLEILERASATLGSDFRSRVEARIVSRELNVRQVLAKVSLGEAQAGIVYRTDVRVSGDQVSVVSIPPEVNVIADYPIAVVSDAAHPRLARAWVDYVLSAGGQRSLREAGLLAPAGSLAPE